MMATSNGVPAGYHTVQPYLIFSDAQAAIAFYAKAFGATEKLCMKTPQGHVAHAEIFIGDSCIMLADENPSMQAYSPLHYHGSPVSLLLYVPDCDAMYRQAVAAGATGTRPPADEPYGARMAGVADQFGYTWYLSTHQKDMSREEMEALMDAPQAASRREA